MNPSVAGGPGQLPETRGCVLVVEDEFLIRAMLSEELRDAGYDVIEAFNADEALKVRDLIRVDMIVTDVRMPGSKDGIGLLRVVRQAYPTTPVIVTSGHLQPALAATDGATTFFPKPYSLELFVRAVRHELAKNL